MRNPHDRTVTKEAKRGVGREQQVCSVPSKGNIMPRVYFSELQAQIGREAFYNMLDQYSGDGDDEHWSEWTKKRVKACESAIRKLDGIV
jgi:hypothetical protein